MSVNIFGASGIVPASVASGTSSSSSSSSVDQEEIEQKLSEKFVKKTGGSILGDLPIYLGDDPARAFGVPGVDRSGQSMLLLLGSISNSITYEHSKPLEIRSSNGVKFYSDIIMSNNNIGSLRDPELPDDAATKRYVDSAIAAVDTEEPIDVNALLATKLDKTGGILTGSLDIQFGSDSSRSFGVSGIAENRTVSMLLGDEQNSISHTKGSPIILKTENGLQIQCNGISICQLGGDNLERAYFHKDIYMNNTYIGNVHDPRTAQDVVNKRYLESKFVKNQVGFIPIMSDNLFGKHSFLASASSEKPGYSAFKAFALSGDWVPNSTSVDSMWLQIKSPFAIKIHKIGLRGRRLASEKINRWILQGSNDGDSFIDIFVGNTQLGSAAVQFYDATHETAFSFYRIKITEIEGTSPGLHFFQIYSLDPIA